MVTVAPVEPVRGSLNRLNLNISVRMRYTIVFSTDLAIVPLRTAVSSGVPKLPLNGCSMSVPSTAATVSWMAA